MRYTARNCVALAPTAFAPMALTLLMFSSGCSMTESKTPESLAVAKKPDSSAMANMTGMDAKAMADMPGMSDSAKTAGESSGAAIAKDITMSASQILHGKVQWTTVTMSTTTESAVVPGTLVPNEDHTVRIGAPAAGRVVKVLVRPGDMVRVDQPLVTIQSPAAGMAQAELSKAVAQVSAARAGAQYAATARARAERLLALKAIPRQESERAIADDELARAALTQADAEAQRARSTAEQLSVASNASGEIVLRAPIAGVVLSRTAVPGTVIDAGAPLVVITDPSTLWLAVSAPESMTRLFARGGVLRFIVISNASDTLTARIEAVGAGLDEATRTLAVRALVANRDGRLKSEMLANVIVRGGERAPAVLLPDDAVQSIDGKTHVFLVQAGANGGAKITRREVVVGTRAGGNIAVLRGVASGDVVVTAGAFAVKSQFQKAAMPKMEM